MNVETVTVGVPIRDLEQAVAWYRSAFDLGVPDVMPMDDLAEFDLGAFWLQLVVAPELAGREGISLNISVKDAGAERQNLIEKGLVVSDLQRFEGVVEFFALTDLDGNTIGFVTELA
ncbi:MAG: VOC family protein [Rhodoglobus sp.]|uniref:VOC family protein n=1 Tax=uncultured Salinibacterium sp. TaxID=459274 RepID=UPI0030DBEE51|tara:strand:- start:5 stop:355 length:351 start_codon:yes stop_codon:yes gene_type:complete